MMDSGKLWIRPQPNQMASSSVAAAYARPLPHTKKFSPDFYVSRGPVWAAHGVRTPGQLATPLTPTTIVPTYQLPTTLDPSGQLMGSGPPAS